MVRPKFVMLLANRVTPAMGPVLHERTLQRMSSYTFRKWMASEILLLHRSVQLVQQASDE